MLKNALLLRDTLYPESAQDKSERCVFPFSCVSHLISQHPLMKCLTVTQHEVHRCLAELVNFKHNIVITKRCERKNATKTVDKCQVKECGGTIVCSIHDGMRCCNECGIVQKGIVFGEHRGRSDDKTTRHDHTDFEDIPKWVVAHNAFGDTWTNIQMSKDIEHWNAYVQLDADALEYVKLLANNIDRRASKEAKIAAAFLFLHVEKSVDISVLNSTSNAAVPIVQYKCKTPIDSCAICNEKFYVEYDRKHHNCQRHKLKKRPQLSLVLPHHKPSRRQIRRI